MALDFLGYDPWTEEGRLRRAARVDQLLPQQSGTGRPVLPSGVSVGNPTPEYVPVTSYDNQINLDESVAYPAYEGFEQYVSDRNNAGLGWMPMATPMYEYSEQRDPKTGDYLSRGVSADYSGMPAPLVDFAKLYGEQAAGRLSAEVPLMNKYRHTVTDNAQIGNYIDPRTGVSTPYPFLIPTAPGASVYDPVYYG